MLRHFKWDAAKLQEEWFSDPNAVREKVGLVEEVPETRRKNETCSICFESFPIAEMSAARCKHYFCQHCWKGYIHTAIEEGPSCLHLRCPADKCIAVVPTSLVERVCDPKMLQRYREFSVRSFVDDNKRLAWCTAPGCSCAAETLIEAPREPFDIICHCGNAFCFTCKEEAHRPVDCDTVRIWMIKNSAESENMTWILANTKACPKCSRPIEKNQGCMHMTCSQCRHEFCWLCLGPWSQHGERTGGFYSCNAYKKKQEAGEIDPLEQQRSNAKASLERYTHYWQRWAEHDKSRASAMKNLEHWQESRLALLEDRTATPASQLNFVLDACREVVSCRRILKWTYAAAYYWFDDGSLTPGRRLNPSEKERLQSQKEFFEFTQQEAEHSLERITDHVEERLEAFLGDIEQRKPAHLQHDGGKVDPLKWSAFREELIGLTDVTRSQFVKLVDFLEKGVEEGLAEFAKVSEELPAAAGNAPVFGFGDAGDGDEASGSGSGETAAKCSLRRSARNVAKKQYGKEADRTRVNDRTRGKMPSRHVAVYTCPHCTHENEGPGNKCELCRRLRTRSDES